MLLTIHDANLKKVAFIDNEKQSTLNYFDDTWTRNLETGSSTFEFTVFKKSTDKAYNYLNERAFVSFEYNGKSYVFSVMTVEENEQTITCYCENLNLELINEYANSYKATKAMSFVEYCNAMDLLNYTYLSVGINEISDQKRTLEWDGQDTKLARLLSLAKKFDAEIDFDTRLNADSSIKSFKVNVYHKNDGTHQGVGRIRNDIQLTYGKNLKSITRKIDKTNVVNAIRPTGTKDGNTVVISGLSAWEEKNAEGIVEFYQKGEMLYAPISMQLYPSAFINGTTNDQWTRKDITVDSDNPSVIRSTGIRELKKNAYPAITYDVDGFIDVDVGDTVKIYDDGFSPILLIEARVADQKISFTNPDNNKTTFANFTALENRLSDGIQERLNELIEQAKPYTIKLSADNGVVFKNNIGQSIVTPTLYKGGKPVTADVTWRWSLDGNVTTGMTYTVRGANVTDTATLTIAAYIGNDEVAVDEISFVNVLDGTMGTPGTPGKDGRTPYVHTAWANNSTGTSGFSLDSSINKLYIGIYTDFEPADSTDPTKYKWTLIKGEKGDPGNQGIPGIPGADGRTPYTHWAYANSADGTLDFNTDYKSAVGLDILNVINWEKNTSMSNSTLKLSSNADGSFKVTGKGTGGYEVLSKSFQVKVGDKLRFTVHYTNRLAFGLYNNYGLQFVVNNAYTESVTSTSKIVLPNEITGSTEYQLEYTATTSNIWMQLNFDGVSDDSQVDLDVKIEVENLTNPVKYAYMGTYTDYTATDSTVPTDYTWSRILGADGIAGKDGVGITSTTITYASSSSGTTAPSSGWTSAVPNVPQGQYLWTKTVWTYTDNTTETGYSVAKIGADGQTAVVHWAYSGNADGTGLTFTDNGQRYIGQYSDYTQADSTDKTKYRWADRWAKIEVGGRNYFKKSTIASSAGTNAVLEFSYRDNETPNGFKVTGNSTQDGVIRLYDVINSDGLWTVSFDMRGSQSVGVSLYVDICDQGVTKVTTNNTNTYQRYSVTVNVTKYSTDPNTYNFVDFANIAWAYFWIDNIMIEKASAPSDFQLAPEDIEKQIDSKADQVLTQEQLNALNEKNQILETEMQAKASMEAFSEFEKAYQSFVKSNADSQAKSEADLIEAGRRIELLITQFGGLSELKTFIDTYMSSSNEGLIIGKNDASSTIKVSSDRISMFSAGKEVVYISQGVIHIDNGIFTASVQIGKFRTEQYRLNADINVVRYVG